MLLVTITALLLTGCGRGVPGPAGGDANVVAGDDPDAAVVVGTDGSAESRVVAALYQQLLIAAGKRVTEAPASYATPADTAEAVISGTVALAPMYETALLRAFPSQRMPDNMAASLSMALPMGTVALPPASAQRGVVVAVSQATASRYGLASLADLAKAAHGLTVGGAALRDPDTPPVPVLASEYGTTLTEAEPTRPADLQVLRSTDPVIARDALVVLDDPRHLLPPEHVFPLMNVDYADEQVRSALDRLRSILTTRELTALAAAVSSGEDPRQAAVAWLGSPKLAR